MGGLVPFNHKSNLNNMLDDFFSFSDNWFPRRTLMADTFKIDVRESEKEYKIDAEMPGIKKDEISLSLNEGRLTISVSRNEENENENDNYIHRERRFTSMSRSVYLADSNEENISAKLEEGILKITVPKQIKSASNRKIEIQ
jgi:HSP20 family protein